MGQRIFPGFVVGGVMLALLVTSARADWPVARHDPQRTAAASGTSTITKPAPYWQIYLGGTLSDDTHLALDINQDGTVEIVYLAGGRAIAKLPNNQIVWASPPVELTGIDDVADVYGDGGLEVVAHSTRGVVLLSGKTGKVLWTEPAGEVGAVSAVRVGDLNGDGHPDILIDDCACCGTTATSATPGAAYTFAGGAPKLLWNPPSAPTRSHCGSSAVVLGDWDGNGTLDVAYASTNTVLFASGPTGALLGTSDPVIPAVGSLTAELYYATCDTANVDGRPGDELVCYSDMYYAADSAGSRSVFVATYDAAAAPPVKVLWTQAETNVVGGQLVNVGGSLSDLDGDGTFEVTVAGFDGTAWTTTVYDAASGAVLATIPGYELTGIADLTGTGHRAVLASSIQSGALTAWTFKRGASPAIAMSWSLPSGPSEVEQVDWSKKPRSSCYQKALALDLKGNGASNPVFSMPATTTTPATLIAYDASGQTTPKALATYSVPSDITLLTHQVFPKVDRPYDQLLVTRNDGYLVVLDDMFAPTNTFTSTVCVDSCITTTTPGLVVGGYTGAPIAPNLGGGSGSADNVVVTDSRGFLLRLDPTAAWMAQAPTVSWQLAGASSPTMVPGLNAGAPGIVCSQGSALTALSAAGTTLWTKAVPGTLEYDPLYGDVNGDGVPDIFASYNATGSVESYQVYDGKTGSPLWTAPPTAALQWGVEPFAVADYNGDGVSDVWAVLNTLQVFSGPSGAVLAQNTSFLAYFTPTIADVDFDGVNEATMSQGYYPARTFKHDLNTTLWVGPDDRPYQDGARAVCPAETSVWVQPSTETPGLVRLITMNGTSAGATTSLYLAGGAVSPARSATAYTGTLGNVTVKQDLLGTNDHPSALVPSADGYIYALNPCTGALDWAYDVGFPPGEVVFADTSGDGVDEMLVTAADGYLYAFSQQVLAPPAWVYDTDPAHGITSKEASQVTTSISLSAAWAPVAGADAYQLAVTTEGGSFVTEPNWLEVGSGTSTTTKPLPLVNGAKYFQLVRAISKTKGSSPATSSSGVTVQIVPQGPGDGGTIKQPVDAGRVGDGGRHGSDAADASSGDGSQTGGASSGGCSCKVASRADRSAAWLGAVVPLVALARRRRRGLRAHRSRLPSVPNRGRIAM